MITDPTTQKRHKIPFKHSKTIYVVTSGRVTVTVQIHSRKKILKDLKCQCKMDINTGEQQDSLYPAARFNDKE
jgi:hypothetical protein